MDGFHSESKRYKSRGGARPIKSLTKKKKKVIGHDPFILTKKKAEKISKAQESG